MNILKRHAENYENILFRIKPTVQQEKVIHSDRELEVFRFKRREGCSTAAFLKAFTEACKSDHADIVIVKRSIQGVKEAMANIKDLPLERVIRDNQVKFMHCKSEGRIECRKTKSRIRIVSGANLECLRGMRTDYLIIDGVESYYSNELRSIMMMAFDGKVILLHGSKGM